MVTGGAGSESSVLLLSGDMWIKRNPLPQRVAPNHSLAQVQNSIYLIDTKVARLINTLNIMITLVANSFAIPLKC